MAKAEVRRVFGWYREVCDARPPQRLAPTNGTEQGAGWLLY
ncbi:hypothetical protein [Streptomyces sp. 8K308]|nr:hypothetical protein [Streptomyces sp. 8K308]